MKRFTSIILFVLLATTCIHAGKRITLKGVQYESAAYNTATAALTIRAKDEVTILDSVKFGKQYCLVVQVNKAYFKSNPNVTGVILPKSVKIIKAGAFHGCSMLKNLLLPTENYVIEKDAFADCESISNLQGNTLPFLEYKNKQVGMSNSISKLATPKFSAFAEKKLKQRMQLWQMKKDYETIEQYKQRVTDENRRKRMDEYVDELKHEYTSLYAPLNLPTSIGNYDSEYGVYTIGTTLFGNVYAQVPRSEANDFRQNFSKVKLLPQYSVLGDTLNIVSCKFTLEDKVYESATNYAGTGESNYNFELPPLDINLAVTEGPKPVAKPVIIDNAVDNNIPKSKQQNAKTFALIIGNEKYKRVASVPFANNDAKIFAEYCKKTLGLPANNVKLYLNAGLNDMRHAVSSLVNTLKAYDGEAKAIVYYAGHGVPDESSQMPYLLPADGFATDIKSGYNLSDLYDELATAPSQMTLVLLDACFSGTKREGDMLAYARGLTIKARSTMPTGNTLVFSASQGSETAYSDKQHGHGMFTYYLLKHLQDTGGNTTMSNLSDYVITNVKRSSVAENDGKIQTPTIIPSSSLINSWQNFKLK